MIRVVVDVALDTLIGRTHSGRHVTLAFIVALITIALRDGDRGQSAIHGKARAKYPIVLSWCRLKEQI
jgi:hypothetical protein